MAQLESPLQTVILGSCQGNRVCSVPPPPPPPMFGSWCAYLFSQNQQKCGFVLFSPAHILLLWPPGCMSLSLRMCTAQAPPELCAGSWCWLWQYRLLPSESLMGGELPRGLPTWNELSWRASCGWQTRPYGALRIDLFICKKSEMYSLY